MSSPPELPNVGDRIRLVEMGPDPCPMEPGATGTVTGVVQSVAGDMTGYQIQVDWDPGVGRSLNLEHPVDKFEIIDPARERQMADLIAIRDDT